MHDSRQVFLLDDNVKCVSGKYEVGHSASTEEFKTGLNGIEVGDYIVVPTDTRQKMTVVRVDEIDIEPDLESDIKMDWVMCKVPKTEYDATMASEKAFTDRNRIAIRKRKKQELIKTLEIDTSMKVITQQ